MKPLARARPASLSIAIATLFVFGFVPAFSTYRGDGFSVDCAGIPERPFADRLRCHVCFTHMDDLLRHLSVIWRSAVLAKA